MWTYEHTAMAGNSTQTNLRTTVALHGKKGPFTSIISYNLSPTNEEIHGTVSMHRQTECLVILYPDLCCKKGRKKVYDEY